MNKKTLTSIITTIDHEAGGKATLIKFAVNLKSQELITAAIHNQAKQVSTVLEGADMLMKAVQHVVKNNPTNFGKFLTALQSSDLDNAANKLERECCEFG